MRTSPFPRARHPRAPITEPAHAGQVSRVAARLAMAASLCLAGCAAPVHTSTRDQSFAAKYRDFAYAEVPVVRQSTSRSCGLAALACILQYWDRPATESALLARHPVESRHGHSLQSLKRIAEEEGLGAFALSLQPGPAGTPESQLSAHLQKGRPVILAVRLPQGRYFGEPVPVIGTLDARTLRPFGLVPSSGGQEYKYHYVVVFGEDPTRYLLMDPAYGIVSVPRSALLPWWKDLGFAALLCSPAPTTTSPQPPA